MQSLWVDSNIYNVSWKSEYEMKRASVYALGASEYAQVLVLYVLNAVVLKVYEFLITMVVAETIIQ